MQTMTANRLAKGSGQTAPHFSSCQASCTTTSRWSLQATLIPHFSLVSSKSYASASVSREHPHVCAFSLAGLLQAWFVSPVSIMTVVTCGLALFLRSQFPQLPRLMPILAGAEVGQKGTRLTRPIDWSHRVISGK